MYCTAFQLDFTTLGNYTLCNYEQPYITLYEARMYKNTVDFTTLPRNTLNRPTVHCATPDHIVQAGPSAA